MQDFEEQERRLMTALGRLGAAMERLNEAPPAAEAAASDMIDSAAEVEIARLSALLDQARDERVEREARVALESARQASALGGLEARLAAFGGQIEMQEAELRRLRAINAQIDDALQGLRGALASGSVDADLINQALEAEVAAMRAARQTESAELEALLLALEPLLAPAAAGDLPPDHGAAASADPVAAPPGAGPQDGAARGGEVKDAGAPGAVARPDTPQLGLQFDPQPGLHLGSAATETKDA